MDQITAGQALSLKDAELLASAHRELLEAQMSGETVLGSTDGGQLVADAYQRVATFRVLLSLVHAGRDLVIPLFDPATLIVGEARSGKCAGFVAAPATTRNEVSA